MRVLDYHLHKRGLRKARDATDLKNLNCIIEFSIGILREMTAVCVRNVYHILNRDHSSHRFDELELYYRIWH